MILWILLESLSTPLFKSNFIFMGILFLLVSLGRYISFFSIAVKHHDHGNLYKKVFNLAYGFRELARLHDGRVKEQLKVHILIQKHKGEGQNDGERGRLEMVPVF